MGREIARSHFPDASEMRRRQFASHLEWILGRFARAPFEERFKDMEFEGPERTADGLDRITVTGERQLRYYLLDGTRLAGKEWRAGAREGAAFNRQRYTVGDLGGGYAVLGEEVTWDLGERARRPRRAG